MTRSKKRELQRNLKTKEEVVMDQVDVQNVQDTEDIKDTDPETEVEIEEKEGFFKRHSKAVKRVAIGLGAGLIGVIGFCLGKESGKSEEDEDAEDDEYYDDEPYDDEESDFEEDESNEESEETEDE